MTETEYDVAVVGGGAGGLSAALGLARARRRVLVIDAGSPRNAAAESIRGFLSRDGMSPSALLEVGRAELAGYGAQVINGRVEQIDPGFHIRLDGGPTITARRVVVATGLCDELPDIPGMRQRWAKDVLHCPYCHGHEVRDQALGVIGTHPGAIRHALLVRQWSENITFFSHVLSELTADDRELLQARAIRVVDGPIKQLVIGADRLQAVELSDGRVEPVEAVFIAPLMTPNTTLLRGLGCPLDDNGYVVTDTTGRTGAPGVWAVGNVADPRALVVTTAGMGAAAAFAINHDLVDDDVQSSLAQSRADSRRR